MDLIIKSIPYITLIILHYIIKYAVAKHTPNITIRNVPKYTILYSLGVCSVFLLVALALTNGYNNLIFFMGYYIFFVVVMVSVLIFELLKLKIKKIQKSKFDDAIYLSILILSYDIFF